MPVLVVDNGAYEVKMGFAAKSAEAVRIPNCISRSKDRRTYVGAEINSCKDYAGLVFRRPHERGQLVNWELQKAIWDSQFYGGKNSLLGQDVDPSSTSLILTESPFSLPALSSNMDQIVFEEYGFDSYYRCSSGSLVPWNDLRKLYVDPTPKTSPVSECALVIDSGFSATHILPVVLGEVYWPAVRRINIGGKHLTNLLKETVSFRHYNMMDESYIMNVVKERSCFVSLQYNLDLEEAHINKRKSAHRLDYALPDYRTSKVGHVLTTKSDDESHQVLSLTNERFTVPEILFNPSDIGIDQAGIAEATSAAVRATPPEVQSLLWANVVLVGGNARLPGYSARVERELRSFVPQTNLLRVGTPEDPTMFAWNGGCALGMQQEMLAQAYVTRKDYLERGPNVCLSRFGTKKMDTTE